MMRMTKVMLISSLAIVWKTATTDGMSLLAGRRKRNSLRPKGSRRFCLDQRRTQFGSLTMMFGCQIGLA